MQLTPGQLVGDRFEVEALVGEGGLAEVYRVRHKALGRVMALKLLTWRKKSLQERLVLEGRIQAQLDHPNIVSVIDLVHHDGQVGLLMEYVDAENLFDYLQREGSTPQAESLELLAPILCAVDAAHSVGITHRDLKPGNIMLARVGTGVVPKVTDFGIAKVVQEATSDVGYSTRAGSAMGTPGYLAPEQVQDASTIDARADVFALGAIAYEVLAGVPAFADAEGRVETTATVTIEPVPIEQRAEVTPCVMEAIQGALTKDVDQRTASIADFAEKLLHSRPDLLAAFHSQQVKPINLSLPPTDDTGRFAIAAPSNSTVDGALSAPTIAPPSQPPTPTVAPAAVGGWIAAGVLGTLVLLVLIGVGVVLFVGVGATTAAQREVDPPTAPAPTAPVPAAAPVPVDAPEPPPVPEPAAAAARPAIAPAAAPRPAPAAPDPAPTGTDEAPEPEPVVIEVPAADAVPEPEPEPIPEPAAPPEPAPVTYPAVGGAWSGKAGGQRMALELAGSGGQLSGTLTLYAGTQVRTESIRGTIDPNGNVSFRAGDLAFTGKTDGGSLSGMYMRDGAKKTLTWSASK